MCGRAVRSHRYNLVDVPISSSEAGHLRPLEFDGAKHALLQEELKVSISISEPSSLGISIP
jgi:hypothetical protein